MKSTQKATSGEQKLNILSYNPGLKKEFHICCSNLPKTILDLAKLCILPDFLPQPSNFFTRIYSPYPWHFATLIIKSYCLEYKVLLLSRWMKPDKIQLVPVAHLFLAWKRENSRSHQIQWNALLINRAIVLGTKSCCRSITMERLPTLVKIPQTKANTFSVLILGQKFR